ncbi:MAG: transporter substrate-binding domain-containing protein [Spirochaetales bacterium]|nr:transporter substrate-binding domain-containing protein [Spirochaetales bacterium]
MKFAPALLLCLATKLAFAQATPSIHSIVVVCDNDYPPYSFQDDDGRLKGILPDLWKAWQDATGVRVELRGMEWSAALEAMRAGQADVIDTIFRNDERDAWLDFTPPYAELPVPVFFHSDISGLAEPEDLRGFRVAAKRGDACVDVLRAAGVEDISLYPSYDALVDAALDGTERIFCLDEPPALYLLQKAGAARDYRKAMNLYTGSFHRAVAKGDAAVLELVERGFNALPPSVTDAIDRRWFGSTLFRSLDPKTVTWLAAGSAVLALFIVILALAAAVLKRTVAVRTAELAARLAELAGARARLEAMVNALPDYLFVFDREGRYLEAHYQSSAVVAAPVDDFLGKSVYEVLGDSALHERACVAIDKAIKTNEVQLLQYTLPGPDGGLTFDARIARLDDKRALCLSRDVTSRELTLRKLSDSLREKEALLKEIHHRVKNNLQIVSSLLSIQSDRFHNEYDRGLFQESQDRVRAMAHVHEQLYRSVDLSSISAGDYLRDLFTDLCDVYLGGCTEIEWKVDADDSQLALEDAVPIGLIANELVTNSLKYAFLDRGHGTVYLRARRQDDGWLAVSVEDDGRGFPDGFEPEQSGGMGYTIVRALAQQLGASLTVGGRAGGGSSVTVYIPPRPDASAADAPGKGRPPDGSLASG